MSGRKIDRIYENPIDNILIDITEILNTLYKFLYFTPNILTFLSLILTLIGIYLFSKKYFIIGGILHFIGYYFDCADGNYARKYNMVSDNGDKFDHVSDFLKGIYLLYVICNLNIKYKTKLFFIIISLVLIYLSLIHLGCQEKIYNKKESPYLNFTKKYCKNESNIQYTKYVGTGTLQLLVMFMMIYINKLNKLL